MLNLLRIQAIVFPLIFWQRNPLAQILFMVVSSLAINAFQMIKISFKSRFTNFVVLANELLLLFSMIGIFLQIVFSTSGIEASNPNVSNITGWIIAGGLLALMGFNTLVSVLGLLKPLWLAIKGALSRKKPPLKTKSPSRLSKRTSRQHIPSQLADTSVDLSHINQSQATNCGMALTQNSGLKVIQKISARRSRNIILK